MKQHYHNILGKGGGGHHPGFGGYPYLGPVFNPGYYGMVDNYVMMQAQQPVSQTYGRTSAGNKQYKVVSPLTIQFKNGNVLQLNAGDMLYGKVAGKKITVVFDPPVNTVSSEVDFALGDGSLAEIITSRNDAGAPPDPYAKVVAAPNISLTVMRNALPQPAVLAIGIITGIALLLLAYKYYPHLFRYFKPKTT